MTIDRQAYTSKLLSVHPVEKLAFAMFTLAAVTAFRGPLPAAAAILLMSLVTVGAAGVSAKTYLRLLLIPSVFLMSGLLAVAVEIAPDPGRLLAGIQILDYYAGVSVRSLILAGTLAARALAAVACMYFLILTTPMVDLLEVMRKMKVPAVVTELMGLTYRFLFVLLDEAARINISQQSRLGYRTLKSAFSSMAQLAASLFVKGFFRTRQMNYALMSRCYRGELAVLELDYRWSPKNMFMIVLWELALVCTGLYAGGLHGGICY